jgi:hypothetical protein
VFLQSAAEVDSRQHDRGKISFLNDNPLAATYTEDCQSVHLRNSNLFRSHLNSCLDTMSIYGFLALLFITLEARLTGNQHETLKRKHPKFRGIGMSNPTYRRYAGNLQLLRGENRGSTLKTSSLNWVCHVRCWSPAGGAQGRGIFDN